MRIIAIQLTETRARVAYRWDDAPDSMPRLLIDAPLMPIEILRGRIEREFLGEPMTTAAYQIVTTAESDPEPIRTAFPGFTVNVLDRAALELLVGWLDPATDPALRDVLAMACWRATPLDFRALIAWLADQVSSSDEAGRELAAIAAGIRVALVSRSSRALAATALELTGSPIRVPPIPGEPILLEQPFNGLPLTVIDGRTTFDSRLIADITLLIVAVGSDPGLGEEDMAWLRFAAHGLIVLVDTHGDPADFAQVVDYARAQIGAIPLVDDLAALPSIVTGLLASAIRHALGNWSARWLHDDLMIRRSRVAIGQFQL